jgi:hypothetical protein
MAQHQLILNTDELDQVVKSLMQSITANTNKRRRLRDGSQQAQQAAREGEHLHAALTMALDAQTGSWKES